MARGMWHVACQEELDLKGGHDADNVDVESGMGVEERSVISLFCLKRLYRGRYGFSYVGERIAFIEPERSI